MNTVEKHPENAEFERVLQLRVTDRVAYDALPLVLRDHAQIYADLRDSNNRRTAA